MDWNSVYSHLQSGSTVGLLATIVFLVVEYSKPEIGYYKTIQRGGKLLGGNPPGGSVGVSVVRFFLINFERVSVGRPFGVCVKMTGGVPMPRDCEIRYQCGPWILSSEADMNGARVVFSGIPPGGVFLIEVTLKNASSSLADLLTLDYLKTNAKREQVNETDIQVVEPRGFREWQVAYRGPTTRFFVQTFLGSSASVSLFFLTVDAVSRVAGMDVEFGRLDLLFFMPLLALASLYYLPRSPMSGKTTQEFSCSYRNMSQPIERR